MPLLPSQESESLPEVVDIRPVLAVIRETTGIDFTQYRDTTLRRRINRRMAACGCFDIESYLSYICSRAEEIEKLVADLTIKYSEFFRDSHVFDAVRDRVLPSIISDITSKREDAAVWSAGCATGEEAYSLAALVRHAADSGQCPVNFKIIGTDVDPLAIQSAQAAVYVKDFLPQPLDNEMAAYFIDDGKRLRPSPEVKELVSFYRHDLTDPLAAEHMGAIYPDRFDLIFCRNVLIYLLKDAQARLVKLCCDLLRPDGFLVIGTKESLPRSLETDLVVLDKGSGIYRKTVS